MTNLNSKKYSHMTLDDRIEIQECLYKGMTFKSIAMRIDKDQTTVSKEVKKHLDISTDNIRRTDQEGRPIAPEICPFLLKAPFVCNPCKKRHQRCRYQKQYYHAKLAQKEYEAMLSESREGVPLDRETFYEIDAILAKGVKQGQHLYHIMQTNNLDVSKSTVYRHLKRGYLSISPSSFPRVVKFKPRKAKYIEYVPKSAKIGRTYDDFLVFKEKNDITSWVEMDTVIGRIGGKVILTLDFTFCNFMVGLLLENKTSFEVTEKLRNLKERFAENEIRFSDIFPLIITDNGGEFSNVPAIENNLEGEKETELFFADPYRSCQKPKVEKNHTMFRDIVPKGRSFDYFTQDVVNMIFSHVNSVKRKSLNGKTPFEMFVFTFGEKIATAMGIEKIPAEEVIQSPKLLK